MNRRKFLSIAFSWKIYLNHTSSVSAETPTNYLIVGDFYSKNKELFHEVFVSPHFLKTITEADRLVNMPNVSMVMEPRRPTMLSSCREVLRRVQILGISWILTSNEKYPQRLAEEINSICEMESWNPFHFLDVAELTTAVSLALDWCKLNWSDEFKRKVSSSIVTLGLNEGLMQYKKKSFWTKVHHNWNIVCNSGMAIGALSVADRYKDVSVAILRECESSIRNGIENFHNDGAWNEGVSYWDYATQYIVYYISSLQSKSIPIDTPPGLSKTGLFRTHLQGPTGRVFNFGDCPPRVRASPQLFWIASRFSCPEITSVLANERKALPLALIWQTAKIPSLKDIGFPKDYLFRDAQIATFRSDWDGDALWLAVKGGDNASNHSHLDIGSFVLEFRGQRFACDLGAGDYSIPTYFDRHYRKDIRNISTKYHSTLTVDGNNQPENGKGTIVDFNSSKNDSFAVIDISDSYPLLTSVKRGFRMLNSSTIVIRDEISCSSMRTVRWNLLTQASIEIKPGKCTLRKGGIDLEITHLENDASFFETILDGATVASEAGIVRLLRLRKKISSTATITIVISQPNADLSSSQEILAAPLSDWR